MSIIADIFTKDGAISVISEGSTELCGLCVGGEPVPDFVQLAQVDGDVLCRAGADTVHIPGGELRDCAERIAARQAELAAWDERLENILLSGGGLQELIDASYPLLRNPIFVVEETDFICARTSHGYGEVNPEWDYILRHGRMPYERVADVFRTEQFRERRVSPQSKHRPFVFEPPGMRARGINFRIPSPRRGVYVGTLIIIENETPLTPGLLRISEILTDAVLRWAYMHDSDEPLSNADRLLRSLLDGGSVTGAQIDEQLRLLGMLSPSYVLAVIPETGNYALSNLSRLLESTLDCFCFEYQGDLLALIPESSAEDALHFLSGLAGTLGISAGFSGTFSLWDPLPVCLRQARSAAAHGRGVTAQSPGVALSFARELLTEGLGGVSLAHPAVGILREYDAAHGTEYLKTLTVWLKNERSVARCLDTLHIHRNTMLFRLERIRLLTGEDFDDPDARLQTLLMG